MEYPTQKGRLIMPEYGRNIQQMVAHALTIEDRAERTRCVNAIIHTMGNLFPYLRDINDFKHKLWDHLAIMSDFQLDIDFPYGEPEKAALQTKPNPIPYHNAHITHMHYGRVVQEMIAKATAMEDGEEKQAFILAIANQMKKNFLMWNKDIVDDSKIWADLDEMSAGRLRPIGEMRLSDARELINPGNGNNKRQAKNAQQNNKKRQNMSGNKKIAE